MTNSLVTTLKEEHYGHKLIYVRFSNEEFVFRTLSKKEYKQITSMASDDYEVEEMVCDLSCVYPEDISFSNFPYAGFPSVVAKQVIEVSGFNNIKTILSEYHKQKEVNTLEENAMLLIKSFIPEYTFEEMEEWTWERLMKAAARAEKIANLKGYDYHLKDHSDEVIEEYNNLNSDNKEFIQDLYQNGVDPMVYFKDEFVFKNEIVDFPLIGGSHWDDEVILDAIRKQSKTKNIK